MGQYIPFLAVLFVCNLIQVVAAFAGTMLAMPFSIILIGIDRARVVVNAASILSCLYPLLRHVSSVRWGEVVRIVLVMLLGILLGQVLFRAVNTTPLQLLYSLFVIGVALRNFLTKGSVSLSRTAGHVLLLAAGIIHGVFLSGGSLLVIYAMERFPDKTEFRASLSAAWLVLNGSMLVMHTAQGLMSRPNLLLIAAAAVPATLGILIGDWMQKRVNGEKFRALANTLLLISGAVLLVNVLL